MIADLKPYLEYKESSQEWLGDVPKHWSVLVNAVAHTDYAQSGAPIRVALFDDRLEVENPGLLPFGLIVDLLRTADGLATHEIAEKIGLTPRATRTGLGNLVARGLVRHLGTGPQDPRRRYYAQE